MAAFLYVVMLILVMNFALFTGFAAVVKPRQRLMWSAIFLACLLLLGSVLSSAPHLLVVQHH